MPMYKNKAKYQPYLHAYTGVFCRKIVDNEHELGENQRQRRSAVDHGSKAILTSSFYTRIYGYRESFCCSNLHTNKQNILINKDTYLAAGGKALGREKP